MAVNVGDILEATKGTLSNDCWPVNDGLLSRGGWKYQWQRDQVDIPGATNMFYTVQQADVGSKLRVMVKAVSQQMQETAYIPSAESETVT